MTEEHARETPNELVRTQDFETERPIEVDVGNSHGAVKIELADTAVTHVEVRHDPNTDYSDWRSGLSGLLSWVSEQIGEAGITTGIQDETRTGWEPIAEAVHQTRIDMTGNRLAVRTPSTVPLRNVPLSIKVLAPTDSQVSLRTGSGRVDVVGVASRVQIQSGSGTVSLDHANGNATVRSGSGQLRLGAMTAGVQARSGSGDIEITSIEAPSSVVTGSGDVWLGAVTSDVLVRSGSGDITIADAAAGQTELITGSGGVQVALRRDVAAEIDLTSSTGDASSDLPIADEPPEGEPNLRLFGRTGSGSIMITTAV